MSRRIRILLTVLAFGAVMFAGAVTYSQATAVADEVSAGTESTTDIEAKAKDYARNGLGKAETRHGDACTASPDSGPGYNFHEPCHRHDACYGNPPRGHNYDGRLDCDRRFLADMQNTCTNSSCRGIAQIYYEGVRDFGAARFRCDTPQPC